MATKEDILVVIKKNIKATLEDIDVDNIDFDRTMKEYDLNSLDVIEIISNSMRDLKIKVPREQLEQVATINQLIDAFVRNAG